MSDTDIACALRAICVRAGAEIIKIYGEDFETAFKADESPVTAADLAADAVIASGLAAAFPDIPVVTEEQAESHDPEKAGERFFLVDPLDGTKEFVKRRGEFTVNIALIENGVPVCGVVYAPAIKRLFRTDAALGAVEETGAFDFDAEGAVRKIATRAPDNSALAVVASKSHRDQATDDYIARYAVADVKSAGSSLKFCLLAAGEADFYPRLGRTMEWDTAAGHAVLLGAGGRVERFDAPGKPLAYGKPEFENPFFVALADGVERRD